MNDPFHSLEHLFQKADSDLQFVVYRLEVEFNKKLENTKQNPLKLIQRIKRIQDELPAIQDDIERIVACKQSLLDSQRVLFSNGLSLERLQVAVGGQHLALDETESYKQLSNVLENWESEKSTGEQSSWTDSDANDPTSGLLVNREDLNANILRTVAASSSSKPTATTQNTQITSTKTPPQTTQSTQSIPQRHAVTETESFTDDFKPIKKERNKNTFEAVSEEEFMSLGSTVRGKCKLVDVNKLYEKIWNYFKDNSKASIVTIPILVNQGAKITGLTGETTLNILRCLKLLEISKKGISLVK
eukprot:TRINITY_DN4449_c0_g1_i1.p1 TRINITY_DN4449_c0_g1~~TRINITY_DN4449_c0_g1_i1.p1  ORF type:complete len:302 (-),score=69.99 TRINITY_DN4449_c0_g1_i1:61-966(-)